MKSDNTPPEYRGNPSPNKWKSGGDLESRLNRARAISEQANPGLWAKLDKAESLTDQIRAILDTDTD